MMKVKPTMRPTAQECMQHPWLVKKIEDSVDDSQTQNSLRNLRRFRVRISSSIYYNLGRLKTSAGCFDLHRMSTLDQRGK
jgi:serine/threonine protein kinase